MEKIGGLRIVSSTSLSTECESRRLSNSLSRATKNVVCSANVFNVQNPGNLLSVSWISLSARAWLLIVICAWWHLIAASTTPRIRSSMR